MVAFNTSPPSAALRWVQRLDHLQPPARESRRSLVDVLSSEPEQMREILNVQYGRKWNVADSCPDPGRVGRPPLT
jgi:hypothetical protein